MRSLLPKSPAAPAPGAGAKKSAEGAKPAVADKAAQQAGGAAAQVNKQLQVWIKKNYETAMLFVSYFEVVVIMGRVILGAVS